MSGTPIYHITDVRNLERIIRANGLWCDAERVRQGFESVTIAHQSLKERRARTVVPVAATGTLADYVPFYFASRSPMLYAIHTNQVEGYTGGQKQVIYLVATVQVVAKGDRKWAFTDGHAVEQMTKFYDQLVDLKKVDWPLIGNWSWKNTDADPDRKRRKQAEFLVHGSMPWGWFDRIGVIDRTMAQRVRQVFDETNVEHRPRVVIEPKWYYGKR